LATFPATAAAFFILSLSRWERVAVRAYRGFDPIDIFVFECHSPITEHK
jgi:hypothetical protein